MHDTLRYFERDPMHRPWHQDQITFASTYRDQENYCLPLSHDEVVHEKRSLLGRLPGKDAERFANLRALLGYQWLFPGKSLLFMGGELGQSTEWSEDGQVDWAALEDNIFSGGIQQWVADLNGLYRGEPALWAGDYFADGFYWLDCNDQEHNILRFVRQTPACDRQVVVVLNLAPVLHRGYRLGLPRPGNWWEALNSDSEYYGGQNHGNAGGVASQETPWQHQPWSAEFTLPPLSCVVFVHD